MKEKHTDIIRQRIRGRYAKAAGGPGCGGRPQQTPSCCGSSADTIGTVGQIMGYSQQEIDSVADGANLGLGCGNPNAMAKLKTGETVLDLGSGAGFDCFLAAKRVGEEGRVIGVDMTPEMLSKARENADKMGIKNVEFRLGEIEHLPVGDNTVDVILSNCVINLSPEKQCVFQEAFRVLKPGGRLAISDVVATAEIPDTLRRQAELLTGCIAGAERIDRLEAILNEIGFEGIRIQVKSYSRQLVSGWFPNSGAENYVASADIEAVKPPANAQARQSD
jgi:SAM-dependent methyltransferase